MTVQKLWESYRYGAMPPNVSDIQLQETRRAFYAGIGSYLRLMMTEFDPGTEPTDSDVAKVEAVFQEVSQFARDVQAGKA